MQLVYFSLAAVTISFARKSLAAPQTCPTPSALDLSWAEQEETSAFTCSPVVFPSGNRQQAYSGQRLNTYFAYWRSSQSIKTPLPIALVIAFHSKSCPFSKALLPLMDEVAQQYSRQSIRFIRVDTAQLAYSDLIKMGITSVPVVRLHTQVKRLTFTGNRTLSALTQYITNYTDITTVPQHSSSQAAFDLEQTVYTKAPLQAATATLEDMRSLSTAPLTLLAELILVLFLLKIVWKQPWMHKMYSWLGQRGQASR